MNFSQLTRVVALGSLLAPACGPLLGYELTGQTWPPDTTVTMQLELGPTGVHLIDGLGTWDNSAADALALWNQNLELVKFSWVLNSNAPKDSLDGYNSVFFSNTVLGEGFGDNTLAATIVWYNTLNYGTAIEADVVFNTAQTFNSYRGPLLPSSYDFHRVALHEFGHVLGLAHVYDFPTGQALMEPIISNLDHLAPDDIAGVDFLYGYRFTSPSEFGGFIVGQNAFFAVTANNHPTSFSAVGLPSGLQLDPLKGEVSGVPLEAGTFEVTITAHGFPRDVVTTVTVFIGAAGVTSGSYPEPIQVGTFITYTITAGNSPTSFTATGLPPGLTLDGTTGVISGVPTLNGNYGVAVVAHGAQYDASGTVSFGVTPAFRPSIAELSAGDTIIRTVQDPIRDRLYVLTNRELKVVDTQLKAISQSIPLNFPIDFALSVDNTKIWVTEGTSIHAYSLTDFSPLPDIPNGPFHYRQIREGLGNKLYVTNPIGSSGLYVIDETTGAVTPIRAAPPGTDLVVHIDTSPNGRNVYASFIDGPPAITRYDISGDTAVMLATRTLTTPNLFDLEVSRDGKLLAYTTDSESNPSNQAVFTVPATDIGAAATQIDPGAENPFFNFDTGTAYVHTVVNTGYQHYQLDFVSTASGFPYKSWD
ncbi:MAG TPA: putative Ig domain-containing protein, partial [Chthoniobacterales bacterium]|nr:putative Ig domain-containing protein [Chthoniobacterales bacterium]